MKYVLITGASTGIGYATTERLIAEGFFVFGNVRKSEDAARLQATFPERFEAVLFDVTDEAAIASAVEQVRARIGTTGLTGLVNNAGIGVPGPLQYLPIKDIQWQFEVNVFGVLRVTQAFLPLLGATAERSFPPGRLINVSSISGIVTSPMVGPYSASKFALESLSDALRMELSLFGIKVIVVQPGPIKTPIWQKALDASNRFLETPYGKFIKAAGSYVRQTEAKALPAARVADVIHRTLVLNAPKSRYIVARNGWVIKLLPFLPDSWKDRIIMSRTEKGI